MVNITFIEVFITGFSFSRCDQLDEFSPISRNEEERRCLLPSAFASFYDSSSVRTKKERTKAKHTGKEK